MGASPKSSRGRRPRAHRECIPLQGGSLGPAQPRPEGNTQAGLGERPEPSGHGASTGRGHHPRLGLAGRFQGARTPRALAPRPHTRQTPGQPLDSTWKCRMIVQIRPRVSLGLPSAMSSFLMFTSFTWEQSTLSHTCRPAREGARGRRPARQPHLAVSEVVQGNLNVLQLVEAHPPLLPGLQEEARPVSTPEQRHSPTFSCSPLPASEPPRHLW